MLDSEEESNFVVSDASVNFGETPALRGVSLSFCEGERIALIGPSGSGKTTLLRLLNAAQAPTSGEVTVLGRELSELTPTRMANLRSRLGHIPQDLGLVPNYRVIQNVILGRIGSRGFWGALRDLTFPSKETVKEVYALLERVGISEKLYHRTSHLSGGQQQRVAIARSLFQKPRALFADEPVSSVDPARARDLIGLLTRLAEEEGLTLVVSLHNLELAKEFFPRIVGLEDGKVQFDDDPQQISKEAFADLYDLPSQVES